MKPHRQALKDMSLTRRIMEVPIRHRHCTVGAKRTSCFIVCHRVWRYLELYGEKLHPEPSLLRQTLVYRIHCYPLRVACNSLHISEHPREIHFSGFLDCNWCTFRNPIVFLGTVTDDMANQSAEWSFGNQKVGSPLVAFDFTESYSSWVKLPFTGLFPILGGNGTFPSNTHEKATCSLWICFVLRSCLCNQSSLSVCREVSMRAWWNSLIPNKTLNVT